MTKEKGCALLCRGCGNRTALASEDVLVIMALKETCPESRSKCPKCGAEMSLDVSSGDGEAVAESKEEPALQAPPVAAAPQRKKRVRQARFDPNAPGGHLSNWAAVRSAPPGALPVDPMELKRR